MKLWSCKLESEGVLQKALNSVQKRFITHLAFIYRQFCDKTSIGYGLMTEYVIYAILVRTDSKSALNGENWKHLRCRLRLGRAHSSLYGVNCYASFFQNFVWNFQSATFFTTEKYFFCQKLFFGSIWRKMHKKRKKWNLGSGSPSLIPPQNIYSWII